ncbi:hypothetical protein JRG66_03725 [Salinimicrobium tongyeongense]|uniref:CarboxypepD_reg-like domain-containing protein n=1 Tax=Salinimicrobium tongyeongense TaxID=2809707 RepID=A0ABY6NU25_9FLAO|nr:hypothetical protein [Salinimicrobium tongyeongense]UZH55993.1 hypothetical protein JRG66_03725 [Salinimicrobium tongyeongense]
MNKTILFIILLLLTFCAYGQERSLLKGRILIPDAEISSINIINLTSKQGTTNKANGTFEIEVKTGDTLLFSSVQYEVLEMLITEELLKMAFLTVHLEEKIDELAEVNISNISLSGNLATDLKDIPTLTQADIGFPMNDVLPPTSIERKLITASSGFDGFLNTLNGKIKMLKKAAAWEDLEQMVTAGANALPVSFFKELSIPENRIRDFVYFCAEDPDFESYLPGDMRLELMQFYKQKAPKFIEEKLLDNSNIMGD